MYLSSQPKQSQTSFYRLIRSTQTDIKTCNKYPIWNFIIKCLKYMKVYNWMSKMYKIYNQISKTNIEHSSG